MPSEEFRRSNVVLFLLALPVILEIHKVQACRISSGAECEKAPFVPGYNLAGEGFDVVRMHRTGAYVINVQAPLTDHHTCTLCTNRFNKGQVQRVPAAVLDWRPVRRCSKQISSALHHSVDSLLRSSSSLENNNWGLGLNIKYIGTAVLGGSRSEWANFARSQYSVDKATFVTDEISCTYYSYRLANHPQLSEEFTNHLKRLPRSLTTSQARALYRQLINTYGTHYIHKVQLGGKVRRVTAVRTCLASLSGFSESKIQKCLTIDLRISLGFLPASASISKNCDYLEKVNSGTGSYQGFMTHKIEVIGGEKYFPGILYQQNPSEAYHSWMNSLHDNPDVVSYSILPLHNLVQDSEISANLKTTITEYIEENKLQGSHLRLKTCYPTSNLDRNCCPLRLGRGSLRLEIRRAARLYADPFSKADAYVKIFYNGEYMKTKVVLDNDNPVWNVVYSFSSVAMGQKLNFEIWDSDVYYDDILGKCYSYPVPGTHSRSCDLNYGDFYFTYTMKCHSHLTGSRCEQYSPSA